MAKFDLYCAYELELIKSSYTYFTGDLVMYLAKCNQGYQILNRPISELVYYKQAKEVKTNADVWVLYFLVESISFSTKPILLGYINEWTKLYTNEGDMFCEIELYGSKYAYINTSLLHPSMERNRPILSIKLYETKPLIKYTKSELIRDILKLGLTDSIHKTITHSYLKKFSIAELRVILVKKSLPEPPELLVQQGILSNESEFIVGEELERNQQSINDLNELQDNLREYLINLDKNKLSELVMTYARLNKVESLVKVDDANKTDTIDALLTNNKLILNFKKGEII